MMYSFLGCWIVQIFWYEVRGKVILRGGFFKVSSAREKARVGFS